MKNSTNVKNKKCAKKLLSITIKKPAIGQLVEEAVVGLLCAGRLLAEAPVLPRLQKVRRKLKKGIYLKPTKNRKAQKNEQRRPQRRLNPIAPLGAPQSGGGPQNPETRNKHVV